MSSVINAVIIGKLCQSSKQAGAASVELTLYRGLIMKIISQN